MKTLLAFLLFLPLVAEAQTIIQPSEATAARRRIPVRLVDVTDGETEETGIAIAAGECKWIDASAASPASTNCAGTLTHVANGNYYYEATAAEVANPGSAWVYINDAAAKPFTGSVSIPAFNGLSATFDGTLQSEQSGNVYYLSSGAVDADDQFNNGFAIVFYDSAGLIKAKSCITDSADTNDAVTTRDDLDALTASNDSYVIKDDSLCAQVAELSSVPTTGTMGIIDQIRALYQRAIHKFVDDGTEQAAYKADGSTKLFECDVADSGSAYTRSACGSPD